MCRNLAASHHGNSETDSMPGLFGVVNLDPRRPLSRESLQSLLDRLARPLRHYDGYITGTFTDPGAGCAVGRIGLPHHHTRPWPDDARTVQAESHAFVAGRPHGETAAAGTWQDTRARIHRAGGSFAAVLHAPAAGETIILTDRQGSQPVFYASCDGLLLFAPEVKALLGFLPKRTDFDWAALATFLSSGYLLTEQSFFTAVRRLPGGTELRVADGKVGLRPYWQFRPGEHERDRPLEDYVQEAGARIDAAVARDLDTPETTALLLSGGVDSRAILGAGYRALGGDGARLHAVTWGCAPERTGADIGIARQLAARLGVRHEVMAMDMAAFGEYGATFRRVNHLLDGMSASAVLHADKFAATERLYARGVRILLRGEQSFGFAEREYSTRGSLSKLGLRRFRDSALLQRVVAPDAHRACAEASDHVMDAMTREADALDPNDFTHRAYFRDRYQRLSGAAAYYKQVLMDHRSPLMDDPVLDLIERLPKPCRDDKALLYRTVERRYPELAGIDYAGRNNLEDWEGLLATDTPVRRYARAELADDASGVWELLDRKTLLTLLDQVAPAAAAPRRSGIAGTLRARLKPLLYRAAPRLAAAQRLARSKNDIPAYKLLIRALILKHWHDSFVRQ
ncbi:MAG: hypothetical protein IPK65_14605 [Gammaproteobacteria bacterium]|nr:hypothetical protein [Gammaproteobacteria bacterium]